MEAASGGTFRMRRNGAGCLRRPILFCLARKAFSTPLSFSYEKESAVDGRKKESQRGELRRNKLHIPHPVRRLRRTGVVRFALLCLRSRRPSQQFQKVRTFRLFSPWRREFGAEDTMLTHSRCSACDSAEQRKCRVCPWHTDRSPRTRPSTADVCGA